ncbi:hypothetical protein DRE_05962 [Drechslerella stenobrocha 248]|uniref:Uncharacterized protein n=1 Tax=Drechslerella stenobrocha 248 TaxID=1043628 RepID=W7I8A5_9PEZI|nr:hypothetical protein DRE_05962 [Drechslerella stenobrocha 248]
MFSFLRTSQSLWKRRLSLNPELLFYRVKLRSAVNAHRWGLPVAALGLAGGIVFYNKELVEKVVTTEPWYIPLWFMHETKPVPYAQDGSEFKDYRELMANPRRSIDAEDAVIQAIKKKVLGSNVHIGHWEGFAHPFWMTLELAAPPAGQARTYLAVSLTSIDIVTRPVLPGNVMRLNAAFHPRATAAGLQAFSTSLFSSFRSVLQPDEAVGAYKPPTLQRPPQKQSPGPKGQSTSEATDAENIEAPLLPSGVVMALHDAASIAYKTLQRELARDFFQYIPPPPRGWIVADGTVRMFGSELALIVDFRVAFDPKNFNKMLVYDLKVRNHRRRGNARVSTFQNAGRVHARPAPPAPQSPPKDERQESLPKPPGPVKPPVPAVEPPVPVETPTSEAPPKPEQGQQETQRKQ